MHDNAPLRTPRLARPFAALDLPDFRLLFANGVLASIAISMRMLVHGWLVLELSGDSPFWVGVSAALTGLSQLSFAIAGGVLVDRLQRRTILIVEHLASAVLAAFLAIAIYYSVITLSLALLLSVAMGVSQAFNGTATNALIYDIGGPRRLLNASALWRLTKSPAMVFGSILAGALIGWVGLWAAYAFIAFASLAAPVFLLPIRSRAQMAQATAGFLQQAAEGLKHAARDPAIRTLLTVSLVMETFGFSLMAMVPVVAKNVLEAGPFGLGFLSASMGAGSLVGILVIAALGDFRRKSLLVFVNAAGAGLFLFLFSFSRSLPLSMALAVLTMGFLMAYDLNLSALLQLLAPPRLRGRVLSMYTLATSFTSLGGFITGALGSIIGVPTMLAIGGGIIVGNALLRRRQILRVQEGPPGGVELGARPLSAAP